MVRFTASFWSSASRLSVSGLQSVYVAVSVRMFSSGLFARVVRVCCSRSGWPGVFWFWLLMVFTYGCKCGLFKGGFVMVLWLVWLVLLMGVLGLFLVCFGLLFASLVLVLVFVARVFGLL